jgi:predicted RNase H-like HicB family nuclease
MKKCYLCRVNKKGGNIMEYTAIIKKTKNGKYIAQCEQIPGAVTQGDTYEEAMENLKDAIELMMETEKKETQKSFIGSKFIRRKIAIL